MQGYYPLIKYLLGQYHKMKKSHRILFYAAFTVALLALVIAKDYLAVNFNPTIFSFNGRRNEFLTALRNNDVTLVQEYIDSDAACVTNSLCFYQIAQ